MKIVGLKLCWSVRSYTKFQTPGIILSSKSRIPGGGGGWWGEGVK